MGKLLRRIGLKRDLTIDLDTIDAERSPVLDEREQRQIRDRGQDMPGIGRSTR